MTSAQFGQPLHSFGEVESTQGIARRIAEQDAPEGSLVQAASQSAGRGRLGNSFHSPPGGLYLSLVLRPSLQPAEAAVIGLAAGLGVAEAIRQVSGLVSSLKWPNDVLVSGRKVCGLLLELATEGRTIRYGVLGVGINANTPQQALPEELRSSATSLADTLGHEVSLDALRKAVLDCFELRYRMLLDQGPKPVLDGWRAWPNMLGQPVRVVSAAEAVEGLASGIDSDGALLLRLDSGAIRRVVAGEVHVLLSGR